MGETRACRGAQDEERVSWPLLSLLTLSRRLISNGKQELVISVN